MQRMPKEEKFGMDMQCPGLQFLQNGNPRLAAPKVLVQNFI